MASFTLAASSTFAGAKFDSRRVTAPRSARRASVVVNAGPKRVMIAGAPASGKGTQCELIVEKYGLVHISAGDLLRAAGAAGTPAGNEAKEYMDRGDLVPDSCVVSMVVDALNVPDAKEKGWLLDGYPRSASQADAIAKEGIEPDTFLLLDVPDDVLIERVVGRRLDPETGKIYHMTFSPPPADIVDRLTQRSDDTEEKAKNRLAVHASNVEAVVGKYTGKVKNLNGDRAKTEVFDDVCGIIDAM
ncbi:nucleoside monophosphate kinase [bacterium]|nr:nucleoside monophosphate kinase [bacterium]